MTRLTLSSFRTKVSKLDKKGEKQGVRVYPNVALNLSCAGERFHVMRQILSCCLVAAQGQAKPTVGASQSSSALDEFLAD